MTTPSPGSSIVCARYDSFLAYGIQKAYFQHSCLQATLHFKSIVSKHIAYTQSTRRLHRCIDTKLFPTQHPINVCIVFVTMTCTMFQVLLRSLFCCRYNNNEVSTMILENRSRLHMFRELPQSVSSRSQVMSQGHITSSMTCQ